MHLVNFTYSINAPRQPIPRSIAGRIVEREIDSPEARAKIEALQVHLLAGEQIDIPLEHFFANKVYARQGIIKKGTVIIGHIKKCSHINIISYGDISIFTEEGEKRITGPATMIAAPGTKRVGYAHEDTMWTTIIGTEETEVEKVEDEVIAKTYEEYLKYCAALQIEGK
jgi:hypothetical protein